MNQSKKTQTIAIKVTGLIAGKQVKATLYDSSGTERGTDCTMVYLGDEIKVGMTAKQTLLATWGNPVMKNDWRIFLQWVFERGSSTIYVYIRNGKVFSVQSWNYSC